MERFIQRKAAEWDQPNLGRIHLTDKAEYTSIRPSVGSYSYLKRFDQIAVAAEKKEFPMMLCSQGRAATAELGFGYNNNKQLI